MTKPVQLQIIARALQLISDERVAKEICGSVMVAAQERAKARRRNLKCLPGVFSETAYVAK